jgi:hypothetical protein
MKFCWYAGALAILVSVMLVGCGGGTTAPPTTGGDIGPPMPAGEVSPLMAGSAEEAEKMGRGPGRGEFPEGYRDQGVPTESGGPGGPPSGPPQ